MLFTRHISVPVLCRRRSSHRACVGGRAGAGRSIPLLPLRRPSRLWCCRRGCTFLLFRIAVLLVSLTFARCWTNMTRGQDRVDLSILPLNLGHSLFEIGDKRGLRALRDQRLWERARSGDGCSTGVGGERFVLVRVDKRGVELAEAVGEEGDLRFELNDPVQEFTVNDIDVGGTRGMPSDDDGEE